MRLVVAIFLCSAIGAVGQVTGDFYLEKSTFSPNEPLFLYFQVTNEGKTPVRLHSADPYSFCSGYEINVSSDPKPVSSCPPPGIGGSCLSGMVTLKPGATRTERLLLNFDHKLDAPGEYSVEAIQNLPKATNLNTSTPNETVEVRTKLYFRIDDSVQMDISTQRWVDQLRSPDAMKRLEAARTLASLAPKSLEQLLLTFADNQAFRQFAPLAFHRLNTARSAAALADLLIKTEPGTYENIESSRYLADTNDPRWFPLLLHTAQQNARISNYVDDAARLGGDKMIPALISLSRSPDKEFARVNAITAFGSTGSRASVPILLEYLRSSDTGIAERALYGLRLLTHRTDDADGQAPQSQYPTWTKWWAREGSSAPIYKSNECSDLVPLP